jgi:hypothetical protein
VWLHLTSSVWSVVWWGFHTGYFQHDIYTPVTCVITSDINCMICGLMRWPYRILYTWYIYTSIMCAYIWHQVYELWFYQLSRQDTLHMIYIYTSNRSTYIWHQVYNLWFYQLSRQDTLHMIYIHQYNVYLHLTSSVWPVVLSDV